MKSGALPNGQATDTTGSVTDSRTGEDFVQEKYGINAGNARRDGARLFELVNFAKKGELVFA